jgi:glycosyltransferase involved in cell wall biosynthesis
MAGIASTAMDYDGPQMDKELSDWISPAAFEVPVTPVTSTWIEHTPFALWLMDALRPRLCVELGTLHGVSYFTFCQGSARNGGTTRCFAVDTWQGDEHTGLYTEEVWRHVASFNSERFGAFSTLLRRKFDDAVGLFEDGSIDLLHIDGLHTFEAVRHDFETWLPKLAPAGIILFHDSNVHERDFGVARFMRELEGRYPIFEFLHGYGLSVVAAGGAVPAALRVLFGASKDVSLAAQIRQVYCRLGAGIGQRLELQHERERVANLRSEVANFPEAREQLSGQIAEQNIALQQERQLAANLRAELSRLTGELEILMQRNAMLEQELTSRSAQAEALLSSTSWRMSAPLRFIGRSVRSLLRPVRMFKRLRATRVRQVLAASGLFDGAWYLSSNADVALGGIDPLLHFVLFGAKERRRASAFFDTAWYLNAYRDVAESGVNPLLHYWKFGAAEGRDPNAWFDTDWYLQTYPDVAASGTNPLLHFQQSGGSEGRWFNPQVDPSCYLSQHPEFSGDNARLLAYLVDGGVQPLRPTLSPLATLPYEPLISVITPVYNVPAIWLGRAVGSVQAQTYRNWEICLCDDGSTNEDTLAELDRIAAAGDSRIKVIRLRENSGISAATNAAIDRADGEFVAFLDNDDELDPRALEANMRALNRDREIDVLYSDEDKLDHNGQRVEPFYKPDWSPQFFRQVMYVGHLLVARRSLVTKVGGLDPSYDGVQDFELMLRLSERTKRIHHIRDILYHWRRIPGSVADSIGAKPRLGEKQVEAVNAHLRRLEIAADARPHPVFQHRACLLPRPGRKQPRISIVIPTKDRPDLIGRCLDSIFDRTTYPDFEVVVVDNGSTDPAALAKIDSHSVTRVHFPQKFNFSLANNLGVAAAKGEILVLLNNDTEICEPDWLEQMVALFDEPDVVAVGPLLLYPNGKVQHAGVALGLRGTADHVLRGLDADNDGYFGTLSATREVSAVTAACMMLQRSDYLAVGGMNEFFEKHYQDVDLSLKLQRDGRRILFTPRTRVIHHESATRGSDYDRIDRELLIDAWGELIACGDPYSRWEPETRGTRSN